MNRYTLTLIIVIVAVSLMLGGMFDGDLAGI